jgi:hypothetical protein
MTLTDAIKSLAQREAETLATIRDIAQSMDVESSIFWTRTAETQLKQGFQTMRHALIHPEEDDH